MKLFTLSNYDEFCCIGTQCQWTCCRDWKIHIDKESIERYNSVSGKIGADMKDSIQYDKKGNAYIKFNEDGFCPLLNEQKLCRVYIEAGEDKMCNTCQSYPRGINIYGDLYMKYICISCPEMARILFTQKEPLKFKLVEDEKIPAPQFTDFNWSCFNSLKKGMFTTINILQNRTLPMNVRMQMALLFNDIFQDCLLKQGNTEEIITMFSKPETMEVILENLQRFPKGTDYYHRMIVAFNRQIVVNPDKFWNIIGLIKSALKEFKEAENIDMLSLAEFMNSEHLCIIFENYCVYYVMQHYLKSYDKTNPQECITKMIQFSVILAWLFGLYKPGKTIDDYTVIVALFSRETEHSPNHTSVFDKICDGFSEQGMGATDYLLSVLA